MEEGWAASVRGKETQAVQCAWHRNVPFFFVYAECAAAADAAGRCGSMREALPGIMAFFFFLFLMHPTGAKALGSACRGHGARLPVGGGHPLLTPGSLGWCRGAAGPGPRRSAGWGQPCAPAAARRSRRTPPGRLRAGARAPPAPGRGRPVGGGDGGGRRRDPGGRPGRAGWSAPACTPATTALRGGRSGADFFFPPRADLLASFLSPAHPALRINHIKAWLFPYIPPLPFSSLAALGVSKSLVAAAPSAVGKRGSKTPPACAHPGAGFRMPRAG